MLRAVLDFFKREKLYAYLFAAVTLFYAASFILKDRLPEEPKSESKVLENYKAAEERLQAKVKEKGSLDAYFENNPEMQVWVNLFSLLIMIALGAGLVINFQLLFNPKWKERLNVFRQPPPADWKFSLLFKFFLWFFTGNIFLGFALMMARNFWGGNQSLYLLLHTTGAEILSLIIIAVLMKRQGGSLRSVGLWLPEGNLFKEMIAGWTGYLAIVPVFGVVIVLVVMIAQWLHYEPPPHPLVPIFLEEGENPYLMYYSLTLAAVAGPIFEEIFFRGFFYPVLKRYMNVSLALVTTAAFFAFIHENSFAFWPIFILGLGLGFLYEKRGSLAASMTMHITHNLFFLGYFFFTKAILSREIGG